MGELDRVLRLQMILTTLYGQAFCRRRLRTVKESAGEEKEEKRKRKEVRCMTNDMTQDILYTIKNPRVTF